MREVRINISLLKYLWLCSWICKKHYSDNGWSNLLDIVGGRSEEWDESVRDR